jgi:hypothetical protein
VIAGAEGMGGEQGHGRNDALEDKPSTEVKQTAKSSRGKRRGPDMTDHYRISEAHGHLREIGRRKRRANAQRCPDLGENHRRGRHVATIPVERGIIAILIAY